jgi:hypothetical protein
MPISLTQIDRSVQVGAKIAAAIAEMVLKRTPR